MSTEEKEKEWPKFQELGLERRSRILFKWLETRGWGIVKDVGNGFLCSARTREVGCRERGRPGSVRSLIVQGRR